MPTQNLAQLKKRAKDLKNQARQESAAALIRLKRTGIHTVGRDVKLTEAQHAIAREAGFPSWPKLRASLDADIDSFPSAERSLVQAAISGDEKIVGQVLDSYPDITEASLACACVLASADAFDALDIRNANVATGPRDWVPLLYLCAGAFSAPNGPSRAAIATRLAELGADPNVGFRERETIRGYRTALGAAIGMARDPALTRQLLQAGADIADGPTLYEGSAMWFAVQERDRISLESLLSAEPPQWHVCHALSHCLRFDDLGTVELLLEAGADPNWNKTEFGFDGSALHEAVVLGTDVAVIEALIRYGAIVDLPGRDGRTALQLATCMGQDATTRVLRRAGADSSHVRDEDRWFGACFRGDGSASIDQPEFLGVDHLWICRATNVATIRLMLLGGIDPNCQDDDGARPLHTMVSTANHAAIATLLNAGADPTRVDFMGRMPLDIAIERDDAIAIEQLTVDTTSTRWDDSDFAKIFERAADATVQGDIETLRSLLGEHPNLVQARSTRPHHATLLHYLGANGVEGERQITPKNGAAMIRCLIEAGADPDATCFTYRGGPGATTLALLTSSSHPLATGVMMEMVAALAEGGATLPPETALVVHLYQGLPITEFSDLSADTLEAALSMAVGVNAFQSVTAIVESSIEFDINAAAHGDGATALHQAAINGQRDVVELLLEHGADPRRRDKTFDGPASGWANAGGHAALADFLRSVEARRRPSPPSSRDAHDS